MFMDSLYWLILHPTSMVPKKIFRDLSASTLQVVINQLFGLLIFYMLSRYLDKSNFGELNWSIATLSVVTIILTLGTDVLIVKRIAQGEDPGQIGGLHMTHTVMASLLFLFLLFGCRQLWPAFFEQHNLLIGVAMSLVLTFLSSPFKQIANGKEVFYNFAVMTVTANAVKAILLLAAGILGFFSIKVIIAIFIVASLIEWIVGAWLAFSSIGKPLKLKWDKDQYKALLLESLPQLGVLLFDSALARVDWILIGLMKGPATTGEYSFAYKIFEISRLPMLVIAPVILPKFVRYLNNGETLGGEKKMELSLLLKFETAISVLIPIFFNITWTPLMSWLTAGKYGSVDAPVYLLLSVCVPLHYFNNFLWTMAFAQKQLKLTFYITVVVSLLNFSLNLLLIPKFSSRGAALAFVISTLVQFVLYKVFVDQRRLPVPTVPLLFSMGLAAASIWLAKAFIADTVTALIVSTGTYLLLIFVFRLLHPRDLYRIMSILKK